MFLNKLEGMSLRQSRWLGRPVLILLIISVVLASLLLVNRVLAESNGSAELSSGEKIINIYDRGQEKTVVTRATTVKQVLEAAEVEINEDQDVIEPALETELIASKYNINIYRAKSVTVIDGALRQKIVTAQQTPEKIAESAKIKLYPEDEVSISNAQNLLVDGADLVMNIDRADLINFKLYGKKSKVRTRAETVADFLREKDIKLGKNDFLSVKLDDKIRSGMSIELWREGKQTITQEEDVDFPVDRINDADREVGYRRVKEAGEKGRRNVTYEIEVRNGVEVSRKEIASVTIRMPKTQVEIVGAKPSFGGDFAAALAKLRSCEGGYNSWNPSGPYYGAYQFDRGTWASVADPKKYGNATPAEQDEAARQLYLRRGWQPWPSCGAGLPDIYR